MFGSLKTVFTLKANGNVIGKLRTHWHTGIKVVPEAGSEHGCVKDGAAVEEHGLDEEHLPERNSYFFFKIALTWSTSKHAVHKGLF